MHGATLLSVRGGSRTVASTGYHGAVDGGVRETKAYRHFLDSHVLRRRAVVDFVVTVSCLSLVLAAAEFLHTANQERLLLLLYGNGPCPLDVDVAVAAHHRLLFFVVPFERCMIGCLRPFLGPCLHLPFKTESMGVAPPMILPA